MKAEELARLIDGLGLMRHEFAAALGVHKRSIYRWLSGKRRISEMTAIAIRATARELATKRSQVATEKQFAKGTASHPAAPEPPA